jgi:hypothetical protein
LFYSSFINRKRRKLTSEKGGLHSKRSYKERREKKVFLDGKQREKKTRAIKK